MNGLQTRPAQRLRVQGVLAVSFQLVRGAAGALEVERLRGLMSERRRLLRELRNGIDGARELGCFEAMQAAVEESDRALDRILKDPDLPCTTA
ncbi:hypothetical protein EON77_17205 [bacterium]|nr:MAG: hypothetical protein EON77_17205 [bacterium]